MFCFGVLVDNDWSIIGLELVFGYIIMCWFDGIFIIIILKIEKVELLSC